MRSLMARLCIPRRISPRGGPSHGVTLVELVIFVALLVVLAAMAVPAVGPIVLRYRARGAAWQVAGDLRLARQRAVTLKKRFRFCVAGCAVPVPAGGYSVEREDGAVGSGVWVSEQGMAARLPPDVGIAVSAAPTFTLTGTASPGTVNISNLSGAYQVTVAQSGRVQVCEGVCP